MYTVLVCDDEEDIVAAIEIYLSSDKNYKVITAHNGKEAIELLQSTQVHLIIMDIMMPVMDGITAMNIIRRDYNVPIIMLTAKSEDTDKILGLNVGADDYITKPFNPMELLARVKSQIRRYTQLGSSGDFGKGEVLVNGGIVLDDSSKRVLVDGEEVKLTPTEFDILKLFMSAPGHVFSSDEIYNRIWNENPMIRTNTVAVHIRRLREKIEITPDSPRYLKVVWGQGYKIERD